eukprot:TRINITY_DN2266_c0_g1_i1.p1 TRINITY_DN2266_c0_g1~~TRINITY_DN2266_c0_g1_i1.p1  ORF type:complete len:59 (+),score=26.97 TRINITY_DN2266_c0_g1_i1:128-304(+)
MAKVREIKRKFQTLIHKLRKSFQGSKTCQLIFNKSYTYKKKKYRLRGRSSETAKAHRG